MVLQIRIRKALENESELLIFADKNKSFKPTDSIILELFAPLKVMWLTDGNRVKRQLPKRYSALIRSLRWQGQNSIFIHHHRNWPLKRRSCRNCFYYIQGHERSDQKISSNKNGSIR